MKRSVKLLAAALFAATALFAGSAAKAQDAPPAGGFKNAYLNLNKSGKVVLTYTLWKDQIGKGKYTLSTPWPSSGHPGPMRPAKRRRPSRPSTRNTRAS